MKLKEIKKQTEQEHEQTHLAQWQAWLRDAARLRDEILARRGGKLLDVDALWRAAREDLEARDDRTIGRHHD